MWFEDVILELPMVTISFHLNKQVDLPLSTFLVLGGGLLNVGVAIFYTLNEFNTTEKSCKNCFKSFFESLKKIYKCGSCCKDRPWIAPNLKKEMLTMGYIFDFIIIFVNGLFFFGRAYCAFCWILSLIILVIYMNVYFRVSTTSAVLITFVHVLTTAWFPSLIGSEELLDLFGSSFVVILPILFFLKFAIDFCI